MAGTANKIILFVSLIGAIFLANIVSVNLFGRLDLTENRVNVLSDESIEALHELVGDSDARTIQVRLFISPSLPDKIPGPMGEDRILLGVPQKLRDKLQEFVEHSDGHMDLIEVSEGVEGEARKAGLVPFEGDEAKIKDYELERSEYYIGATFEYKGQKETLQLALEPNEFEYQITRRLLRLKDRIAGARKVRHLNREANALMNALTVCDAEFHRFEPEGDKPTEGGMGGIVEAIKNTDDEARKLAENRSFIQGKCDPLVEHVAQVKESFSGEHKRFDELLAGPVDPSVLKMEGEEFENAKVGGLLAYVRLLKHFQEIAASDAPDTAAILSVKKDLITLKGNIEELHESFERAPGERKLGFICGHGEFCPFRSDKPVVSPQIAQMLGQQNPQQGKVLQIWAQIQQQVDSMLEGAGKRSFLQEDFAIEKLDASKPIPTEYAAIVIYAPKYTIPDEELYHIDQYLLSGGTVIAMVENYDVALQAFLEEAVKKMDPFDPNTPQPKPEFNSITPEFHNLNRILGRYGVTVEDDLVADGTQNGQVFMLYTDPHTGIRYNKGFNYPLLPATDKLDRGHPLVRTLEQATMPYSSSIRVDEVEGQDLTALTLIQSSDDSVLLPIAKGEPPTGDVASKPVDVDFPLEPEGLMEYVKKAKKDGPHALAVELAGTFHSAFEESEIPQPKAEEGKDAETDPATKEPEHIAKGEGRLLVVSSALALPPLSTERIFRGLKPFAVVPNSGDAILPEMRLINIMKIRNIRNQQAQQSSGPLVLQTFRWGAQPRKLSQVEAKHNEFRPIDTLEEGTQNHVVLLFVGVIPLLVLFSGLLAWLLRRLRQRKLAPRVRQLQETTAGGQS